MDVGLGQTGYTGPSQGEDRHRGSRTSHYRASSIRSIIQIKQTCNCTLSNTGKSKSSKSHSWWLFRESFQRFHLDLGLGIGQV